MYNIAIVGASGLVGGTFLKVLEERDLPIKNLYLFASARSAGKEVVFKGKTLVIEELTENSFDREIDIALFSAGGDISKKFAPIASEKGVIVVDNSSAWRMDEKVADNNTTVVIASHNLRELEDLCDRLCLMHRGHMMLERGIDDLRHGLRKVQVAFTELPYKPNIFEGINAINITRNGNIFNLTIKGTEEEFMPKLKALNPAFVSAIPLTLEEIFISEMGAAGYDIHSIL